MEKALKVVLDFVERHNKQDKEIEAAEAAQVLSGMKDELAEIINKAWITITRETDKNGMIHIDKVFDKLIRKECLGLQGYDLPK